MPIIWEKGGGEKGIYGKANILLWKDKWAFRETNDGTTICDYVRLCNSSFRCKWSPSWQCSFLPGSKVSLLAVKLPKREFMAASLSESSGFSQIREAPERLLSVSAVS